MLNRSWIVLLLALALCLPACETEQAGSTLNVVLISIDTLRADHCSVSGYERETTPNLEAFAAEGARIELAYAPTATTGPTHATLFTSLYPISHGLVKNGQILHEELRTLAEVLGDAGYRTGGIASSYVLDAKFGFAQGFEHYDDDFDASVATWKIKEWQGQPLPDGFDRPADVATDRAIEWLDGDRGDRPFFLFVHYFDPHAPYVPPEPFASRFAPQAATADDLALTIAAYDAEIAFTDHELGRLLDHLEQSGLDENTLVLITADHGEGLMQHGHPYHGVQIYEEAVRIPLLMRLPGAIEPDSTHAGPVELVDVGPTILELAGLAPAPGFRGLDLTAALGGGGKLNPERPVFLHRRHYEPGHVGDIPVSGEKFGIRAGAWKYIVGENEGTRELFNLDDDPGELRNLFETNRDTGLALEARIEEWKQLQADALEQPTISEEERERLRGLGYVQ